MCSETPFARPPNPLAFGRQAPTSLQVRAPVRAGFFDAGDPENFPEQEAAAIPQGPVGPENLPPGIQEILDMIMNRFGGAKGGKTRGGFPLL